MTSAKDAASAAAVTAATAPSETSVAMCHIVSASDLIGDGGSGETTRRHRCRRRRIRAGLVLRLMDAAACASAEKLSGHNSVTLSMDDVTFEDPEVDVGEILVVRGRVNAAWGTSMEVGVLCEAEGGGDAGKRRICRAFTTFVSLSPDSGTKIRLPPLSAETDEDVRRLRMAEERRRIRFRRGKILRKYSTHEGDDGGGSGGSVDDNEGDGATILTELVLPQHANHHGNAFGGQIMEWMGTAAIVATTRHAASSSPPVGGGDRRRRPQPRLSFAVESIDDVFFVGPSRVGDRLEMDARPVFRLSDREVEVSVTVHAFGLDRTDRRMVNQAFCVVGALAENEDEDEDADETEGGNGRQRPRPFLPDVIPRTAAQRAQHDAARGRAALRLERLSVRSAEAQAEVLAWKFEGGPDVVGELCRHNVLNLLAMRWGGGGSRRGSGSGSGGWVEIDNGDEAVALCFKIDRGRLLGRVAATLPSDVRADELFDVLLDNERRPEWDGLLVSAETVAVVDESNDVQRLVVRAPPTAEAAAMSEEDEGGGNRNLEEVEKRRFELVVLRSWRKDPRGDSGEGRGRKSRALVIANHSIQHPVAPASPPKDNQGIPRGTVGSSGWIVEEGVDPSGGGGEGGGKLTYIATLGPSTSTLAREMALGHSGEQFVKSFSNAVGIVRSRRAL